MTWHLSNLTFSRAVRRNSIITKDTLLGVALVTSIIRMRSCSPRHATISETDTKKTLDSCRQLKRKARKSEWRAILNTLHAQDHLTHPLSSPNDPLRCLGTMTLAVTGSRVLLSDKRVLLFAPL